eukprot:COSAG06_NODE_33192_length_493_cov_5.512690_1_plen_123_part_01
MLLLMLLLMLLILPPPGTATGTATTTCAGATIAHGRCAVAAERLSWLGSAKVVAAKPSRPPSARSDGWVGGFAPRPHQHVASDCQCQLAPSDQSAFGVRGASSGGFSSSPASRVSSFAAQLLS